MAQALASSMGDGAYPGSPLVAVLEVPDDLRR